MTGDWRARFPDLAGKAAVVAGDDTAVVIEVVRALAGNGVLVAGVVPGAPLRDELVAAAVAAGAVEDRVLGFVADPADAGVLARLAAHIEQRLAPIDLAVAIGSPGVAAAVTGALIADMGARGRGVLVVVAATAVGSMAAVPRPVRRRSVVGGTPADVAAAVQLCCSDTLRARELDITLTG